MHAPHRASTTAAAPSQPIDYRKASREVRAVFDDIKNKQAMAPGELDPQGRGHDLSGGEHHQLLRVLHRQPQQARATLA